MTNKPFHTTNSETLLSGIHLDEEFRLARERKKKPVKHYPKHLVEALERSINVGEGKNMANSCHICPNFKDNGSGNGSVPKHV